MTAGAPIDLQRAAKERRGFEGARVVLAHAKSPLA
jgi:hypothetical protein